MSTPSAPYYYRKGRDTYHWEKSCSKVPTNVSTDPDWVVTNTKPSGKEQCNECRNK